MVRWFDRSLALAIMLACAPALADDYGKGRETGRLGREAAVRDTARIDTAWERQFVRLHMMNWSNRDLLMAVRAAELMGPGTDPLGILQRVQRGETWMQIARQTGRTLEDLMPPPMRVSETDIWMAIRAAQVSRASAWGILQRLDRGQTWPQIARDLNLMERDVMLPPTRVAGMREELAVQPPGGVVPPGGVIPNVVRDRDPFERVYVLTPIEFRRLRAMGLSRREIFLAANAAALSGRPVDDIVQMIFRGMTAPQIAARLNVDPDDLDEMPPAPVARALEQRAELGVLPPGGVVPPGGVIRNVVVRDRHPWSRAFVLTPLEHKRLRAMGLTDRELFLAANAAALSGRPVDDIVQMIFRGMTAARIAERLNINPRALDDVQPEWRTREWEEAVRRGSSWPPVMTTFERERMERPEMRR